MGMGDAGMIITSDYGSFPHSLLSTSKKMDYYSYKIMISFFLSLSLSLLLSLLLSAIIISSLIVLILCSLHTYLGKL